jgi:hypothetical protein
MKILVLDTSSTNQDHNADCDYALVEIEIDLARLCLERMDLAEALYENHENFYQMTYWDHSPRFVSDGSFDLSDDEQDRIDTDGYAVIERADGFLNDKGNRVDCSYMTVDGQDIHWRCIPKHSDIYIHTRSIRKDFFDSFSQAQPIGQMVNV